MDTPRPSFFYSGLYMLCMSVLMLQITETRILSVISFYYLAFLTISMAMFGMTVGALLVYFNPKYSDPQRLSYYLTQTTGAFAITVAVCFAIQMASVMKLVPIATMIVVWLKVLILLALPFVFAGMAVSLALTRSPFKVGVVYGVDLVGAASGCLVVLLLLNTVDGPSAIFIVAAFAAAAAFLFSRSGLGTALADASWHERLLSRPLLLSAILLVIGLLNASTSRGIQPIAVKNDFRSSNFTVEKWNSFSRIMAYLPVIDSPQLWSPSPTLDRKLRVEHVGLDIDGMAGTVMPRFNGDLNSVSFLAYDLTNIAYSIRNSGKSAVIGVGSGRDLLSSYLFGFRNITGVELNPIFIDILTDPAKLRSYAGIADLPGVRLFVDDGRSWFARTPERFNILEMSMIDTFASTGAGAFSLSENGLYTAEAWKIFLSSLTPDGVFTVSRWHSAGNPVESGRMVSLAMAALYSMGVQDPRSHIFLATYGPLATIVVGRQPLAQADVDRLAETCSRYQFGVVLRPDQPSGQPVFADLISATSAEDLEARAARYPLDLSAPTDARPFFFNQLRISHPNDVAYMIREARKTGTFQGQSSLVIAGNLLACGTLALVIILSTILVIMVVVLPARSSIRIPDRSLIVHGTVYFMLIGLGFMMVEMALIQRISVFLGHPTYGLAVVLFSIILSTGIGSFLSERLLMQKPAHFMLWLGLLVAYLVLLPLWLPQVGHTVESYGLVERAAACVAMILPAGLLMGFGFPTGMRLTTRRDPRPTPWFWGINGAAGVLAGGLGVACSIAFSINTTLILGGVCYLALLPLALSLNRQEVPGRERISTLAASH